MMKSIKLQPYSLLPLLLIIIFAPVVMRYFSEEDYKHLLHPDLFQPTNTTSNISTFFKSLIITYLSPLALLMALIFGSKKFNIYTTILIGIFLAISISTFTSNYPEIALYGSPHMFEGYFVFIGYLFITFSAFTLIQNKSSLKTIIVIIGIPIFFMFYFGVPELFDKLIIEEPFIKKLIFGDKSSSVKLKASMANKIAATLHNPNFLGHFTSLTLLFYGILYLFIKNKTLKFYSLIVYIALCFLTFGASSRSSFIGLFMGGLIALIYLRKNIFPVWKNVAILFAVSIISFVIIDNKTGGYLTNFLSSSQEKEIKRQETVDSRKIYNFTSKNNALEISTNGVKVYLSHENNNYKLRDENGQDLSVKLEITDKKELIIHSTEEMYADFSFKISKFDDKPILKLILNEKDSYPFIHTENGIQTIFNNKIYAIINAPYFDYFSKKESFASNRGFIWKYSIPLIANYPFFGHGAGSFPIIFPNNDFLAKYNYINGPKTGFSFVHNLYLQYLLEFGWIGFGLFMILFLVYIVHSAPLYWNFNPNNANYYIGLAIFVSIISYLISGVFNSSFVGTAPIFFLLLGMGIATNYNITHSKKHTSPILPEAIKDNSKKITHPKKFKNKK